MKRAIKAKIMVITAILLGIGLLAGPFRLAHAATSPKKISIKSSLTISVGQKKKLTVKYIPAKAKVKLVWKSKKPKIASVNSKGVVTGKKKGTTIVTVSFKNNKKISAKCSVKVKKASDTSNASDQNIHNTQNSQINGQNNSQGNGNSNNQNNSSTNQNNPSDNQNDPSNGQNEPEATANHHRSPKPRTIITTDGEFDDANSFVHFILYTNDIDLAGIVQTSSFYHWRGNSVTGQQGQYGSGKNPNRWPGTGWALKIIDAYEEVYPNLVVHDPEYPEPDYLRSIYKVGNVDYEGEMDGPTEGSDHIKDCILDDDPRTLFIQCWGGTNTLAMALKQIEDEYKGTGEWDDIYAKVSDKVIITACSKQDHTYENYIAKSWPEIPFIDAECQKAYGYATKDSGSDEMKRCMSSDWMHENIETGHGPLLDLYITWGDGTLLDYEPDSMKYSTNDNLLNNPNAISWVGKAYNRYDFLSEGDSNTYFNLLDTGLDMLSMDEFICGGLAGRYAKKAVSASDPNSWTLQNDNDNVLGLKGSNPSVMKWIPDIQHDYAVRADWCVTPEYENANHRPSIKITKSASIKDGNPEAEDYLMPEDNKITAQAGETINLHAEVSDPDNNNVNVSWWNYGEAGTYRGSGAILIDTSDDNTATVTIPDNASTGDTICIIARACDDGEHELAYYQRVAITVE